MRRTLAIVMLAAPAVTLAADSTLPSLAGRYFRQFPNGFVSGEKYTGQDIVEIVPVGPGAAYVRIHLDYYNGHSCGIYGVAKVQADALVYREVGKPSAIAEDRQCVLTVKRSGKSLLIDDAEGSCRGYCGMRGTLSDVKLPFASRRPIRYMAKLKASDEYKAALIEWRTGRPYEPWKDIKPPPDNPNKAM